MRIASHDEFFRASQNASIRIIDGKPRINTADAVALKWEHPVDYVVLAKIAFETIVTEEQFLIFHEYGTWPSSENRYLFRLVMKAWLGAGDPHPSQCVHFSSQDRDAAITLFQIGLQSGWGGLLFGGESNWVYFNHDGFGLVESPLDARKTLDGIVGVKLIPQ